MIATPVLSDGQIADFHRDGYVVVPKAFDRNNMATIEQWAAEVENHRRNPAFKLRAEIVERSFAHNLDRRGMRRTWLRRRENVHMRYLLHVTGHNLSLLRRQRIGAGTPREAVAGGYGCIFVLMTPTGAVLVDQILIIVSEDG